MTDQTENHSPLVRQTVDGKLWRAVLPTKTFRIQVISLDGNRFDEYVEADLVALYDANELFKLKKGLYVVRKNGSELHRDIDAYAERQERIVCEALNEPEYSPRTNMDELIERWSGTVDLAIKITVVAVIALIAFLLIVK